MNFSFSFLFSFFSFSCRVIEKNLNEIDSKIVEVEKKLEETKVGRTRSRSSTVESTAQLREFRHEMSVLTMNREQFNSTYGVQVDVDGTTPPILLVFATSEARQSEL